MFTHVMIGSNDLERARIFYDATFLALGGSRGEMDAGGRLVYSHDGSRLMITTPIDGKPATAANGGTIGILATSADHVTAWHDAGAAHGGQSVETP
ncbi:MAG: glyoxalase, partial [Devosia sp.]|nr:glyoxalase [Devosia sp.]